MSVKSSTLTCSPEVVTKRSKSSKKDIDLEAKIKMLECEDNIYIKGQGGVGKTYLINKYVERYSMRYSIAKTAPTGVAALNIGGSTLHSFFGIGLGKGDPQKILNKVRTRTDARDRIRNTDILIIDEISMVGADFLQLLDYVSKGIRRSEKPFGGMRLIVSGDFLQLSPINDDYAFNSSVWLDCNFKVIKMTTPYRFDDVSYWEMLNRIRVGAPTESDIADLYEKVQDYKRYVKGEMGEIKPTIIHSHRKDVDDINTENLDKLESTSRTYKAIDSMTMGVLDTDIYDEVLKNVAPKELTLKVGAQVMLTKNLALEIGLCNGSRGVVKKLNEDTVKVLFKNGVNLDIPVYPAEVEISGSKVTRSQIPLILAYALTIHKIQGATVDFCVMNLGSSIFCPGQAYVALSRVRNWDSLLLTSFLPTSIKADPTAIKFDESL